MTELSLWDRFQNTFLRYEDLGFSLDVSRMQFTEDFLEQSASKAANAFKQMKQLEAGAISNPDENRMVGHYWLRAPKLAPGAELRTEIEETRKSVLAFANAVHEGEVKAPGGEKFTDLLIVGIGGSALGPQFVCDALGSGPSQTGGGDPMRVHFLDNTDPDGIDKVFGQIKSVLPRVLVAVISKSGGTKETRNGMLETQVQFKAHGLDFARQAVAVTGLGSELDQVAVRDGWLKRFPMWDWVGGRTSIMSAVGLVPMSLQGLDVDGFLAGAAAMDDKTRLCDVKANAAMLLALMWYHAGNGRGQKDMVILPYKDRLVLFSKYLQQLVMESLGKERDLDGLVVNQGIAVYGNKGSTDQHAYVQQLRDGVNNFFATFIEVRKARSGDSIEVEPGTQTGDYLEGFLRGTRTALSEGGRESITISIPEVNAFQVGALIALYERAVGFYASLVNVNAYHQPGVEAGKKAATRILALQLKVVEALKAAGGSEQTAAALAAKIGAEAEDTWHALNHLSANREGISIRCGARPAEDVFCIKG